MALQSRLDRLSRRVQRVGECPLCGGKGWPVIEVWFEDGEIDRGGACTGCGKGEVMQIIDLTGPMDRPLTPGLELPGSEGHCRESA